MLQIWVERYRWHVTPTVCSIQSIVDHGARTRYMRTLQWLLLHGY